MPNIYLQSKADEHYYNSFVFLNGELPTEQTLTEIRARVRETAPDRPTFVE